MLNMIESSKFRVVCDGFFVNGRSFWMLLSFKFLIAYTEAVELFISEENFSEENLLEWYSQVVFSGMLSNDV